MGLKAPEWYLAAERLVLVLWYHQPRQLIGRVKNRLWLPVDAWLQSAVRSTAVAAVGIRENHPLLCRSPEVSQTSAGFCTECDWVKGRFGFLHQPAELGRPIDWSLPGKLGLPLLWVFHLHYHEYLVSTANDDSTRAPVAANPWSIVSEWIAAFPSPRNGAYRAAWHPYCISRRVPAWAELWRRLPPPAPLRDAIVDSMAQQARFLSRHLETDLGGNHLWDNYRALVVAGCLLSGEPADRWRQRGATGLSRCLAGQVRDCGEHFERSPMYQADLAHGLAECANWLQPLDPVTARQFRSVAVRLRQFLDAIRHPDGGIPLLGDSTFDGVDTGGDGARSQSMFVGDTDCEIAEAGTGTEGIPPLTPPSKGGGQEGSASKGGAQFTPPLYKGGVGGVNPSHSFSEISSTPSTHPADVPGIDRGFVPVGDYFVHRHEGDFLLFDAGDVGPDHLPAHAHADLLGFECSRGGSRLFVDSGVYCYAGARRNAFRQSRAHNVLTVDELPLADVWSTFRMGRRGHVIGGGSGCSGEAHWAAATHDAYGRQGVFVTRIWIIAPDGVWISAHLLDGPSRSVHRWREFIHGHPATQLADTGEGFAIRGPGLDFHWRSDSVAAADGAPVRIVRSAGEYSPRFGVSEPTWTIELNGGGTLPILQAWVLAPWDQKKSPVLGIDRDRLWITWNRPEGEDGRVEITRAELPAAWKG